MRMAILTATACALALGAAVLPTSSRANTVLTSAAFSQTSDDSSLTAAVGTSTSNSVTVTDLFNGILDIKVTLASGWGLVNTGAGGNGGSFIFGLSGISSLTFGAVDPTTFQDPAPNTWYPTGTSFTGTVTSVSDVPSADLSASGKYEFTSGYGMSYDSNGGSHPFTGLEFTITNSTDNLTLTEFLAALQSSTNSGSTGLCGTGTSSGCFYADVLGNNGNTGLIDFGAPVPSFTNQQQGDTPLPAALPLFATGLGALGLFGWRRKRKTQTAA